jgi:hypothetical protein
MRVECEYMGEVLVADGRLRIERTITFEQGSRHRLVGSYGMDFGNGIIEIVSVMELPDADCVATEEYHQFYLTDPTVAFVPWVSFRYVHERDHEHYGDEPLFNPAELLAEHIALI